MKYLKGGLHHSHLSNQVFSISELVSILRKSFIYQNTKRNKKILKVAGKGSSFQNGLFGVCKFGIVLGLRLCLCQVNIMDVLYHQTQFFIVHGEEYTLNLQFLSPHC